ncbi:hypothetical protein EV360DRAFT_39151, partial [Lentinula raphanica]
LLTPAEQQVLVDWIVFLGHAGMPVEKRTLRTKVKAIMAAKGKGVKASSVSSTLIRNFEQKHKEMLKKSRGSNLDPKRAQAFNFTTVNDYFEKLREVLTKYEVP